MQKFYLGLFFVLAGWCLHAVLGEEWLGYVVTSSGLLMIAVGLAWLGSEARAPVKHVPPVSIERTSPAP